MKQSLALLLPISLLFLAGCAADSTNSNVSSTVVNTSTAKVNVVNTAAEPVAEVHAHGEEGGRYQLQYDHDNPLPAGGVATITLYDTETKQNLKEFKIVDANVQQAHMAEYHDNSLFVVVRPGGNEYSDTHDDWQDELWQYNDDGSSKKIYAGKGVTFHLSHFTGDIGILSGLDTIQILDESGKELYTVHATTEQFDSLAGWSNTSLWAISDHEHDDGTISFGLTKVDPMAQTTHYFDIPNFSTHTHDLAINPTQNIIVTSNYPHFHSADETVPDGTVVSLYTYNLDTEEQNIITSTTITGNVLPEHFAPIWLSDTILEYTDPATNQRTTATIAAQ